MIKLCAPAVIYVIFSITQILIDSFNGLFNTALMKMVVMIMVTFLLQILCENGLNIISWIIVFIPFILMSVIVSLLLYFFGLNTSTGKINYSCKPVGENEENPKKHSNITTDSQGNILIYDPYYNANINPVYYKSPNIIVPKPVEFPKYINK